MRDVFFENQDLQFVDTAVNKAVNVMTTQIGSLYYAQEFGLDLDRFFAPDVEIQTETFKAYTIDRLTACGVDVVSLLSTQNQFDAAFEYAVRLQDTRGLVAQ